MFTTSTANILHHYLPIMTYFLFTKHITTVLLACQLWYLWPVGIVLFLSGIVTSFYVQPSSFHFHISSNISPVTAGFGASATILPSPLPVKHIKGTVRQYQSFAIMHYFTGSEIIMEPKVCIILRYLHKDGA